MYKFRSQCDDNKSLWDRRGRACMVVGFATTYAISACHH